jgi:hypothetical protein
MPTGTLRLAVTPLSTQVFVDGYYEGTVEDLGRGLPLPEGPHTIELRADGYMPTTFDVRIAADSAVSYRGTLDLQREPPAAAPAQASTMYVIPGCYMGNVPPRAERIGANCDVHKVRVIPPQAASRAR